MSNPEVNLGVVGATGLVGETVLDILEERDVPIGELRLFASERSAGETIRFMDDDIVLRHATAPDSFHGLDYVIVSAGGDKSKTMVSRQVIPWAVEAGAIAIDNSSAFRDDPDVPLVVAGVNQYELNDIPKGIVANPNCTTMQAMPPLRALHYYAGLKSIVMSSYQSVSGQGKAGINETVDHTEEYLKRPYELVGGSVRKSGLPSSEVFPAPAAFNVVPQAGSFVGRDTTEELKFKNESRKILGLGSVAIDATCVRVPVLNVHSLYINTELESPITVEQAEDAIGNMPQAEDAIGNMPGVRLDNVPQTLKAAGEDDVFVGRIRKSEVFDNGIQLFVAGDNLRKGAALNAVQILELLAEK
jgi:aspartate-semialdehyde dehydrogenase